MWCRGVGEPMQAKFCYKSRVVMGAKVCDRIASRCFRQWATSLIDNGTKLTPNLLYLHGPVSLSMQESSWLNVGPTSHNRQPNSFAIWVSGLYGIHATRQEAHHDVAVRVTFWLDARILCGVEAGVAGLVEAWDESSSTESPIVRDTSAILPLALSRRASMSSMMTLITMATRERPIRT